MLEVLFCLVTLVNSVFTSNLTNYVCADAAPILLNGTYPFNNTEALSDSFPTCAPQLSRYFLWYSYTATEPVSLIQVAALEDLTYDVVLEVFSNCTTFPAEPLVCSYAPPIVNFKAIPGETYYISVGGLYPADQGTGLLSIAPAQLVLTLTTQEVYNGGGFPIIFTVDAVGVPSFGVAVEINCGWPILVAGVTTSLTPQTLDSPQMPAGNCTMVAYDPDIPSLISNTQSFISYGLIVQQPSPNALIDAGSPFDVLIVSNDPSQNYTVNATVACLESDVVQSIEVNTNVTFSGAQLIAAAWGDCDVAAVSSQMISFTTTQITANTQLTISNPLNDSIISVANDYPFLTRAVRTATSQLASVNFVSCLINGFASFPVLVNEPSLRSIAYWYAGDTCNVTANGTYFIESPQIQISFWNPLSLNGVTNLKGWTGGSSVAVQIDAFSGRAITVDLIITCPITAWLTTLTTNSLQQLELPTELNGIGCLMSTINLPELVLPITPVSIDIGIGREGAEELATVLQFAAFVDAGKDQGY